jgi:tripartite-type tricarboxylate transporter receptor subunit TctC
MSCALAHAQTYPSRPITLVVPFPPGGSTDAAARIMAERMRSSLGQSVVIENVGGAGGSIGVGRVARAAPDGYTFDIGQWDTHVGSIIYKLDYDLEKDFEPIALFSNNPQLLVAKNDLPANTLAELVAWMKDNPGKINFVNQNAAANVTGVLFENLTKQKVQFIPYRGAGPAMTDLIAGVVDLLVVQGPLRCRRSAPARSRRSPICRRRARHRWRTFRPRMNQACPSSICQAGSASGRRRARRRTSSPG